jgi:hypothetical protein
MGSLHDKRILHWDHEPATGARASVLECGALRRFWSRTGKPVDLASFGCRRPKKRRKTAHSKTFGLPLGAWKKNLTWQPFGRANYTYAN